MRYNHRTAFVAITIILLAAVGGCKKPTDTPGSHDDPRFQRLYCNVPEAVNYNWNFPGTPDSTGAICFYPTDVFKGAFTYTDSIYNFNNIFVREEVKTLNLLASSRTDLLVTGFCPTASLNFTASRYMRADADSTFPTGQLLCRNEDTLSGYIFRSNQDSTHIQFSIRVGSDTGVFYHRGTAVKQ